MGRLCPTFLQVLLCVDIINLNRRSSLMSILVVWKLELQLLLVPVKRLVPQEMASSTQPKSKLILISL